MKRRLIKILAVVALLAAGAGILAWCAIYRVVDQPAWIASNQRDHYFYGSAGATKAEGMPYWIWLALPRLFPEHMPATGGYAALGLSWEEGREMPVGFAKQRVGYIRVSGNCALCHAVSHSNGPDSAPTILTAVKGQATDLQPLFKFYRDCAQDPRFNADELFSEINDDTRLSLQDKLLYRYILIPRIQKQLIDDPAALLLSPDLRAHALDPHASGPLSDQQAPALKEWMQAQMQSPAH